MQTLTANSVVKLTAPALTAALKPQPEPQHGDTQVTNIPLPPVNVTLTNLKFEGLPDGHSSIISSNETYQISVDVEFNGGSLVDLLMCVGTRIEVNFSLDGFGSAPNKNLIAPQVTTIDGEKKYTITYTGASPAADGLTEGFYEIAALLTIKGSSACPHLKPIAFGYLGEVVFQVYSDN